MSNNVTKIDEQIYEQLLRMLKSKDDRDFKLAAEIIHKRDKNDIQTEKWNVIILSELYQYDQALWFKLRNLITKKTILNL